MKRTVAGVFAVLAVSLGLFASEITPEQQSWLESDELDVPGARVNEGELSFLRPPHDGAIPHSENEIIIGPDSLDSGWVNLRQCHHRLDAFDRLDIAYRYKEIRGLRIAEQRGIGSARIVDQTVEMTGIRPDNRFCIEAEVRVLHVDDDQHVRLISGPYYRGFLDGYYPYHVSLHITYPHEALVPNATAPPEQSGFKVERRRGRLDIDAWFEGRLMSVVSFRKK
jgi:hypothetical protein